ncbi:aminoglycoside phosphotransferase family protein [Streptomyces sp. NPDC059009]|uniref:aminoglycoside phosphotransferase family protein n=1 Tax=Streptomyces sp. NPDC059009 TaxID=3346694 RepID=UPI00369487B1
MSHPSAALARSVVAAALPQEPGPDVRPVDEGGEHSTWWVGERHVLRLALDAGGSVRQRREVALRDAVRGRVGEVGVPASVASGVWAPGLTYTLDTRIPGASAEVRGVSGAGERDLAALLSGLASFPGAEAEALGVPVERPRALDDVRKQAMDAARQLADGGEAERELPGRLAGQLTGRATEPVAATAPALVLTHCDLKGEHLLVTSAGRVAGVLDWTDAAVADPAEDVAGLALSVGAPAAVRVAALAGHSPATAARGVALARCDTLIRLADRLYGTDDSPLPLLRVQRERAWAALPA